MAQRCAAPRWPFGSGALAPQWRDQTSHCLQESVVSGSAVARAAEDALSARMRLGQDGTFTALSARMRLGPSRSVWLSRCPKFEHDFNCRTKRGRNGMSAVSGASSSAKPWKNPLLDPRLLLHLLFSQISTRCFRLSHRALKDFTTFLSRRS